MTIKTSAVIRPSVTLSLLFLSVSLSLSRSLYLSIYLCLWLSKSEVYTHPSHSLILSLYRSIFFFLFFFLTLYACTYLPISPPIYLHTYLSIYLSMYLCILIAFSAFMIYMVMLVVPIQDQLDVLDSQMLLMKNFVESKEIQEEKIILGNHKNKKGTYSLF